MRDVLQLNDAFESFTIVSKSLEEYYSRLQEKVIYLTKELEEKNRQLKIALDNDERNKRLIAMGELAAKIVHEIRSPLCSIELYSSMLEKELNSSDHINLARGISIGIKSLNNILTNMLFFAKPQKPLLKVINLAKTLKESIFLLMPIIESRSIVLNVDINDNIMIKGDSELLKQVFINIILNSIQASSEGGEITVMNDEVEEYIVVRISDNGTGIDSKNIEKIFDPFFSTKEKGTGLGLTITSKIVQVNNGKIKVESEPGKGSSFFLYFTKTDAIKH